jgi:hypothetical protein
VVTLSSIDTEEALELLFLSPTRDPISHISAPSSSPDSDQIEDRPKANDTIASVYVALTVDTSSSCTLIVNVPCGDQESCADSSSTRQSRSQATLSLRPHRQKLAAVSAP